MPRPLSPIFAIQIYIQGVLPGGIVIAMAVYWIFDLAVIILLLAAPSCGALSSSHSENVCLNKPNELLKNDARLAIDILLALHSLHRSYRDGLDTRLQKIGSNRRAAAKGLSSNRLE